MAQATPSGPATILVIDDEVHLRRVLSDVLLSFGHRVDEARDGAEAMGKLGAGTYDLVMLDLRLPDVDGRVVWQWITERRSDLVNRVVFMTGDTMSEETQAFLQGTGRLVVSKPLSYDRVRAVIGEVAALRG